MNMSRQLAAFSIRTRRNIPKTPRREITINFSFGAIVSKPQRYMLGQEKRLNTTRSAGEVITINFNLITIDFREDYNKF